MVKAVCIYGPPGTGKTERLVREARSFLENGVKLKFLSHTRAAAEECAARIGDIKAASTIHALCYKLLSVGKKQVIDRFKLQGFADEIGIPVGTGEVGGEFEGDGYLAAYEHARNRGISPELAFEKLGRPGTFGNYQAFIASYVSWKSTYGYIDFGDMLERVARGAMRLDFNTLFVDEAQDLSPLQWKVLDRLMPQLECIQVAGDDDQTVYEWGGADPHGMADFGIRYGADVVVLNQSHRVPRATHGLAQAIIHRVTRRVEKQYSPRDSDGRIVYHSSLEMAAWPEATPADPMLILCRDRFKAFDVERRLMEAGIDFRATGTNSILNRPYGKAMVAWRELELNGQITEVQRNNLYKASERWARQLISNNDYNGLLKRGWVSAIPMPHFALDYFSRVDFGKPPRALISTIHGAKGKEARNVVLYLPASQRVLDTFETMPDPEHRLMYVAVTRAKEALHVIDGPSAYPLFSK